MKNSIKCPACGKRRKPGHERRVGTAKAYSSECKTYEVYVEPLREKKAKEREAKVKAKEKALAEAEKAEAEAAEEAAKAKKDADEQAAKDEAEKKKAQVTGV